MAAFERIEAQHLQAAQGAIAHLLAVRGTRDTENTLSPFDEAIAQLDAASDFAMLMQELHPDAGFRDHATTMATRASSAATALSLNPKVYRALVELDRKLSPPGAPGADAATRYYVQSQLLEFRLAGVDQGWFARRRLRRLQDRLTEDQSRFDRNIADDVRSVEVANLSQLDGLPQDYIEQHRPGPDGKIRITTNYPDLIPVLDYAVSDDLRQRLWDAFASRAYPKNLAVLADIRLKRWQIARLLGYRSWADYNAADKMMQHQERISAFIAQLDAAARPVAEREYALLLAEKRKSEPAAMAVQRYESWRLGELVRSSRYDFDSQSVRPYLPYAAVERGILDTAASLFHVSFRQERDAPAWDPLVETWDVLEQGAMIGRFYLDMHPRPGKHGHGQTVPILDGIRGRQLPEAALICNFPTPTATDPGLMVYDEVVTFFHEFGHLMHHILGGQQRWAGISGISMEADFIEAPSQMLEEWMHSPQVLASFAHHYQTGAAIPPQLVARMNRASAFGRGGFVTFQNSLAAISFDLYDGDPQLSDPEAVVTRDLARYTLLAPRASDATFYASFTHLAGYSSAYYTYMWDKVIAEDFFRQFDQDDLLAGDTPLRYRRTVLEPGGSMSANDLVRHFLGRAQNFGAFEDWMGQEFANP